MVPKPATGGPVGSHGQRFRTLVRFLPGATDLRWPECARCQVTWMGVASARIRGEQLVCSVALGPRYTRSTR
jgi:hypothetical protein